MGNICRTSLVLAIVIAAGIAHATPRIVATAQARKGPDACKATTQGAYRSCRQGAQSDKTLALAKCANIADPTAAKPCVQQTSADAKDALGECKDQQNARQAVCDKLGPAPFAPVIDPANYRTTIDNPLFPLVPGTTFVYEGQTAGGLERDEFAVTHNTRTIDGVTCVEVHDTVTTNGKLTEDTLDYFAQDLAGNVWYFGENSREVDGNLITSLEGSWMAGVDGAYPGIIMEAHSAVGDFYRQEFLLGDAEDLAEVSSVDESVTLSNNTTYAHCLKTTETSPLEPDALENKFYAPNVGNVLVIDVQAGERSDLIDVVTGP
jgi:hypothetical protein